MTESVIYSIYFNNKQNRKKKKEKSQLKKNIENEG